MHGRFQCICPAVINPNSRVIAKLILEAENFLCLWLIIAGVGVVSGAPEVVCSQCVRL